ncbi:MAG: LytR/AlgR family response regulator transcription factor [Saprospiraceae bacterium]
MMTYKAIIVDDEVKLQEVIRIKLEKFCPVIEVVGLATNVADAYDLIQTQQPHLVFLDIAMPLESGFDLLQKFTTVTFEVIFITGFDKYALKALKMSAVDYLLKPVNTQELKQAVQKAIQQIETRKMASRFEVLKHNLENTDELAAKVSIPSANSYQLVTVADIIRCEGWQRYTKIYLQSGECIVSSYNIGVFREMLENYPFYQVHKSHLINTSHIKSYEKSGFVILADNSRIPVARRKKEAFYAAFIENK